jgi:hypothetical protein
MAEFNYDKYMADLEAEKDYNPYKVDKGQKWGLALSAIASAVARSQAPTQNFMGTMQMIQQQDAAKHQATLATYQAQMDAVNMQKESQLKDLQLKDYMNKMDIAAKAQELNRKDAEAWIKQNQQQKDWALKYSTAQRHATINTIGKVGQLAEKIPVIGGKIKDVAGQVSGQIEQAIPQAEQIQQTLPQEQERLKMAGEISPEALTAERQGMGLMTPQEQASSERQAQIDAVKFTKDIAEARKATVEASGMEADEEAKQSFFGVLDGSVDVGKLPRPVASRVLGMLQTHLNNLKKQSLDEAKSVADINQSKSSTAANYARVNATKAETEKTYVEINKLMKSPTNQTPLSFKEYTAMPMNVRKQYYEDPIKNYAMKGNIDGVGNVLIDLKNQGMPPEDMAMLLRNFAAQETKPKKYADFVKDYKLDQGMPSMFAVRREDVEKYIKDTGYTKTGTGDYVFSAPFFMQLQDADYLQTVVEGVYSGMNENTPEPTTDMKTGGYFNFFGQ